MLMTENNESLLPERKTIQTSQDMLDVMKGVIDVGAENPNGLELAVFRTRVSDVTGFDSRSVGEVTRMLMLERVVRLDCSQDFSGVVLTDTGRMIQDDWDNFAQDWL